MASITAAGAGSGLNVEGIVSGLMSVEQQPLTKLQKQASKLNTQISDVGKLTSALSSLKSAAQKLAGSGSPENVVNMSRRKKPPASR